MLYTPKKAKPMSDDLTCTNCGAITDEIEELEAAVEWQRGRAESAEAEVDRLREALEHIEGGIMQEPDAGMTARAALRNGKDKPMSVDTSRERIERLKATDSVDYIHIALLDARDALLARAEKAEVERDEAVKLLRRWVAWCDGPALPHPLDDVEAAKAFLARLNADQPAPRDEVAVREWQPIETAPEEGVLHLRGLWVYTLNSAGKKFPAYFQADCGVMNDDGDFVSASGDDFGWSADDYDWWMPMPQAAPPTPDALRALAEGGE